MEGIPGLVLLVLIFLETGVGGKDYIMKQDMRYSATGVVGDACSEMKYHNTDYGALIITLFPRNVLRDAIGRVTT